MTLPACVACPHGLANSARDYSCWSLPVVTSVQHIEALHEVAAVQHRSMFCVAKSARAGGGVILSLMHCITSTWQAGRINHSSWAPMLMLLPAPVSIYSFAAVSSRGHSHDRLCGRATRTDRR